MLRRDLMTTTPVRIGPSADLRTTRWQITCPMCGKVWEPVTTIFSAQHLFCPEHRCNAELLANYHDHEVVLINTGDAP